MKKTKRMLTSILASSLAVMSLPFLGLSTSASASEEVKLVSGIEPCDDNYNYICLYHNNDTKTAFQFTTADLPYTLQILIDYSNVFDDGMGFLLSPSSNLKFPDAEITIEHLEKNMPLLNDKNETTLVDEDRMIVTNHGVIVYVDDNGDEHSFSGFPDLENYIIQNYNVTVVDYDKYMEDGSIVPVDAATTPVNNTTASVCLTGDVSGDGTIDLLDAITMSKMQAGFITPTDVQTQAADINQDGSVTDDDISILMQFLIGVRPDLTDLD